MSDNLIQLRTGQTTITGETTTDGDLIFGRATRDGSLFTAPWIMGLVMQGKVFQAQVGSFLTPIVGGGAGTIPDADQPEFGMTVPTGTTILPLAIKVQALAPLITTDSHYTLITAAADLSGAASLTGTWANTITPVNCLTGCGVSSLCTVKSVASADMTVAPTESLVLAKETFNTDVQGTAADAAYYRMVMDYNVAINPPVFIKGGGNGLFIHWGGSIAMYAYAQVVWAEIPTNKLY